MTLTCLGTIRYLKQLLDWGLDEIWGVEKLEKRDRISGLESGHSLEHLPRSFERASNELTVWGSNERDVRSIISFERDLVR